MISRKYIHLTHTSENIRVMLYSIIRIIVYIRKQLSLQTTPYEEMSIIVIEWILHLVLGLNRIDNILQYKENCN